MRKGDERKASLLKAAKELFFSRGYAATSVNDILDTQNISKGSFYHHYESKLQVLLEICRQQAARAYQAFQQQVYDDAVSRLNGLIYYAMPFRSGEEKTVALLLPLQGISDGKMVMEAMIDGRKEAFFPEMLRLVEFLKEKGEFHYHLPMLPELLWDSYSACYQRMMQEAALIQSGGPTAGVIQILEAERFLWERLLDAPFGSMEIIRGDEALQTISHAISRLKRMGTE